MKKIVCVLIMMMISVNSLASDWNVYAKVKQLEATNMPITVWFTLDVDAGSCLSGTYLKWDGKGITEDERHKNSSAVYVTLMTALVSGQTILLHGWNAGCDGQYVQLIGN